ncbi:MAG: glutamate--tRNA ligase, partial [Clostridia bacterium]|nr:glutamate--tRNA ligase [Clostridia bacterium]
KVTEESAREILKELPDAIAAVEDFTNDNLYAALLALSEKLGVKSGAVMWCVRIAVAGLPVTPGGATEIMEVLGREETLRRLGVALTK